MDYKFFLTLLVTSVITSYAQTHASANIPSVPTDAKSSPPLITTIPIRTVTKDLTRLAASDVPSHQPLPGEYTGAHEGPDPNDDYQSYGTIQPTEKATAYGIQQNQNNPPPPSLPPPQSTGPAWQMQPAPQPCPVWTLCPANQ